MNPTPPNSASPGDHPRLKQSRGWFAAGKTFGQALESLSDGAFRLFAFLCLNADRRTGCYAVTQRALATRLGKSRRIIGCYIRELVEKNVCQMRVGCNQFAPTVFEICEDYWPYYRTDDKEKPSPSKDYITTIRECFITLGCVTGQFGAPEIRLAQQMEKRGTPLEVVQGALLVGACRKYISWINGTQSAPIGSLAYFEPLICEVQQQPLPANYQNHLLHQLQKLTQRWTQMQQASRMNP